MVVLHSVNTGKERTDVKSVVVLNYVKEKGYTIKHFSINKGNLEEVFQNLTNSKR